MAYTDPWSDTRPLGSSLVSHGDDEIRALRLAIHERMDVLVEDWTADPVVPKDSISGQKDGKRMMIAGCAFATNAVGSVYGVDGTILLTQDDGPAFAPLLIAPGCTITRIQWLIDYLGSSGDLNLSLRKMSFNTAFGVEDVDAQTVTTTGPQIIDSGVISELVVAGTLYHLKAHKPSGSSTVLYGVQIVYIAPNSQATL